MITKIAKSLLSDDTKKDLKNIAALSSAGAAGGILGSTLAAPAGLSVSTDPVSDELLATDAKIDKLKKAFGKEDLPIYKVNPGLSRYITGDPSAFVPKESLKGDKGAAALRQALPKITDDEIKAFQGKGFVLTTNDPKVDILAHELGHSTGPWKNALFRGLQGVSRRQLIGLLAAPALSGSGTYIRTKNNNDPTKSEHNNGASIAMTAAGAVPAAAVLGEEGRASYRGLQKIKELGYSSAARKEATKRLAKAFSTYGGLYGGSLAAANAAAYLLGKRRAKQIQEEADE